MANQNISVICTVKNEEDNISNLLDSLLNQTLSADEIIIVDGDSTDKTISVIEDYSKKFPVIKLIQEKNTNIAKGRNIAIKSTRNEIIAVTDAGSNPKKDWLEKLVENMDDGTDVVSGFYLPDARSKFEKILAELTFPKIEQINEKQFLPSSRSICFRKKCWEKVGGYPENSFTAEDTLFDLKLVEQKFNFTFAKDAIVFWRCRNNLKAVFKQWYLYAKGDGILGIVMNKKYGRRHYSKLLFLGYIFISLLFMGIINPILIPIALILGCFYYFLYFIKRKNGLKIIANDRSALWKGPIILFTINLGQFLGIHIGFFKKQNSKTN